MQRSRAEEQEKKKKRVRAQARGSERCCSLQPQPQRSAGEPPAAHNPLRSARSLTVKQERRERKETDGGCESAWCDKASVHVMTFSFCFFFHPSAAEQSAELRLRSRRAARNISGCTSWQLHRGIIDKLATCEFRQRLSLMGATPL